MKKETSYLKLYVIWMICRYLLLRKKLGIMRVEIDGNEIKATRIKKGTHRILEHYIKESKYSAFYSALQNDFKRINLGTYSKINGLSVKKLAKILNSNVKNLKYAIENLPKDVCYIHENKVKFHKSRYKEFKDVIEYASLIDEEGMTMAKSILNGEYSLSIDGVSDLPSLWKIVNYEIRDLWIKMCKNVGEKMKGIPTEVIQCEYCELALSFSFTTDKNINP